jgi:hypothetical protein
MAAPLHTKWTVEDDLRLSSLIERGLSFSAIGAEMGRSKNACIGRAHRARGVFTKDTKPVPPKKVKPAPAPRQAAKPVERLFVPPIPAVAVMQDNAPTPLYAMPEASTTAYGSPRPLLSLEAHHCRFPAMERDGQHLFCSAPRDGLGPYCRDHALLCLRPEPKRNLSRLTKAYR